MPQSVSVNFWCFSGVFCGIFTVVMENIPNVERGLFFYVEKAYTYFIIQWCIISLWNLNVENKIIVGMCRC